MQLELVVSEQFMLFLEACAVGMALGAIYDIFRILRIAVKTNAVILFLQDLLFFILAAVITFVFLVVANEGKIRWFPLFGEVTGFAVYYFTIGKLVMRISKWIISFFKALFRALFRIFIRPFIRLFRWIRKLITPPLRKVRARNKLIRNKVKFSLKKQQLMVYNLCHSKMKKIKGKSKKNKRIIVYEDQGQKTQRKKI